MLEDIFKDRILETENLTDNLEDEEANVLLDWGIGQLPGLIQGIDDPDQAGDKVNALMAFMRKINRLLDGYTDKPGEILSADFAELMDLYNAAFGTSNAKTTEDCMSAAMSLVELPSQQALDFLLAWPTQISEL